jgi:hypothetical protein
MKNEITAPLAPAAAPIVSTTLPVTPPRILRRNPLAHLMGQPEERVTNNGMPLPHKMELSGSALSNAA